MMPFEQSYLEEMRSEMTKYANGCLNDKLSLILDCRSLIEIADDFEERISQYFKQIFKQNREASKAKCQSTLEGILDQHAGITTAATAEEVTIKPIHEFNERLTQALQHYVDANSTMGSYRSQAVSDLFLVHTIDQLGCWHDHNHSLFSTAVQKQELVIAEGERANMEVSAVVNEGEEHIRRLEEDNGLVLSEKAA